MPIEIPTPPDFPLTWSPDNHRETEERKRQGGGDQATSSGQAAAGGNQLETRKYAFTIRVSWILQQETPDKKKIIKDIWL